MFFPPSLAISSMLSRMSGPSQGVPVMPAALVGEAPGRDLGGLGDGLGAFGEFGGIGVAILQDSRGEACAR